MDCQQACEKVQAQAVEIARLQERAKAAEQKADTALANSDRWMENANEWRSFINDLRAGFVAREELDLRMRNLWAVALGLMTLAIGAAALIVKLIGG